ncbi:hypothetical protein M3Y94_00912300 [Aphelenchoides besseyi]|nr:hypothetical protein M3Y94_00912300 [Aphelenchoides besseyi]
MAPPASNDLPAAVNKRILPQNSIIQTTTHQYVVQKQLGYGSFGDVYWVERKRDRLRMAVKIEWVKEGVDQRLPREYDIYEQIQKMKRANPSDLKNLLNYYDYGGVGGACNFLFLPLLGASLKELLATKTPSYCTSIQLSLQTLLSIRCFHKLGRIHRDIKPSNFVQGRGDDTNTIYLIDFGMAVRFCTDPTKMPRQSAYSFIGTELYASRATHKRKPQTRRDDMESWLYVAMETFDREILPWVKADSSKILSLKDAFFERLPQTVFEKLPECFESFARMIDLIDDFSAPNYDFFVNMLTSHAKERDLDLEGSFEWLPKDAKAEKPRSPKKEISFGIKNPKGKSKVSATLEAGEPDPVPDLAPAVQPPIKETVEPQKKESTKKSKRSPHGYRCSGLFARKSVSRVRARRRSIVCQSKHSKKIDDRETPEEEKKATRTIEEELEKKPKES